MKVRLFKGYWTHPGLEDQLKLETPMKEKEVLRAVGNQCCRQRSCALVFTQSLSWEEDGKNSHHQHQLWSVGCGLWSRDQTSDTALWAFSAERKMSLCCLYWNILLRSGDNSLWAIEKYMLGWMTSRCQRGTVFLDAAQQLAWNVKPGPTRHVLN